MSERRWTEADRLAALARYAILDTPAEPAYDDLAALAAKLLDAPIALVNIIGDKRQWFKAEIGLGVRETPLETSFCAHALIADDMLIVGDARDDPRFANYPMVTGAPHLRAYAGVMLASREGTPLGTLCVLDYKPRAFTADQIAALAMLARQISGQFELRRAILERERDRADEREALLRFERSEESLRLAIEAAELGTWDLDLATATLDWSERCKAMFGISPGVPCSMVDFYAGLHPDDLAVTSEAFAAAVDPARRAAYDVEYRTIGKEDRVVRWLAAKGKGLFDADGRCVRAIGTVIDISDRKAIIQRLSQSEAEVRELNATLEARVTERTAALQIAESRIRAVFETTKLFQGYMDRDGILLDVNPAALAAIAAPREEALGRPLWETPWFSETPGMTDRVRAAAAAAAAGRLVEQEVNLHLIGGLRTFDFSLRPVIGASGEVIGIVPEGVETTRRRQAEDALRQSQKMEAVGQLTGGLAHDFNNLLTGMMGNIELLQSRVAQGRLDGIDRFVNAAQGAGRRAAALTQRLLAFSRRQTLDPKPTDVNRLVTGMEDLIRRTVGPAIEIEVVGAAGLWTALIDPGQLENALLNLCINGRDAMPDGGRLTIETANKWLDERAARERDLAPGQYLSLCVTDTGTGMTPDVIARAFDPFYTTKPIGEGTGLGLSMIYGFARQSSGQVRIYSEIGRGTTMCIYLPRYLGDEARHDDADDRLERMDGGTGEIVLVVDDEPTIRQLIDEVLDELGYTVIAAADGAAGLKVLQSGARIDLLVTDVGLPGGMNGRQVADAARALRPGLKVLFITGYAENAAVGNGHLEPGMALLTKPFSLDDLARRIRDLIARPA